ncbi:MAG: PD-(D/E)XK nuclease family protein, partial [Deltaproteobacteria bacterium]|nr:PD-(D/E)XK nuclease family protein [Deltaproteobacteria bacterium]
LELASGLFERWQVTGALEPKDMLNFSDTLKKWLADKWPKAIWHREMPVMHRLASGSIVRGVCDLALETKEGFVVIDHKSFPGLPKDAGPKAAEYAPQLLAYAAAIEAASGKPVIDCLIHMPLVGVMVSVGNS